MAKKKSTTKKTTKRRKPKPEPEPEWDDDLEPEEIPVCDAPGCTSVAMPDSDFCLIHLGLDLAVDKLQKSFRKGDALGAAMGGIGMLLFQHAPAIGAAVGERIPPPAPAPPPPAAQSKVNPFEVLGLDAQKATKKDVKAMQRALSKIYHPDKNAAAINPEMIARVNAAATECLKQLSTAGRP